jgi:hypothetical protein
VKSFELPIVTERPANTISEHGEPIIVPTVDYFLNLLLSHAPAELAAAYSTDKKTAIWSVISVPEGKIIHTETLHSGLFRPCLARIGVTYMEGNVYGGFNRLRLIHSRQTFPLAFYLGNDGLCGFWLKVLCGDGIADENQS